MGLGKLKKTIATILLLANTTQIAMSAISPDTGRPTRSDQAKSLYQAPAYDNGMTPRPQTLQNLVLSSTQLGVNGPLAGGVTYSDLTGLYFNAQYLKKISDSLGINILGEYGSKQYRINGTLGVLLAARTFLKVTAEQLGQQLPFSFTAGNIDERVKQNAFGARLQRDFDFTNLSVGGYGARAPNKRLDPISFISNGQNCNGYGPGYVCIDDRNIAGASSAGGDLGAGIFAGLNTYFEGRVYYDRVRYNTIFTPTSIYNKNGYGGGIYGQHLLAPNLKLSGFAELRKIYDTYNLAVAWMPTLISAAGTEFSLMLQRVVSHNPTPNNDSIGLKVTLFADRPNYQAPMYGLNGMPIVDNIASWVSQPAVKMNQVLAIAEERIYLADTIISSVTPNFGPLQGGNAVVITGRNFLPGVMVRFGQNLATITEMTNSSMTVIVPAATNTGAVSIAVTTPNGKTSTYENAYLYTNGVSPLLISLSQIVGPIVGGTTITLTGANFVPGETSVSFDNIVIPASAVQVTSSTSLTFTTPAHTEGTVLVTATTSGGTSIPLAGGFTYVSPPTGTILNPSVGSPAGGSVIVLTGTGFVSGATSITIGGVLIPSGSVTVTSPTSLSFTAPAHAAGAVDITITTPGGSTTIAGAFNYSTTGATLASISPDSGLAAGGTSVTISGTNFVSGSTSVDIGGILIPAGDVIFNTATSISFTIPPHAAGNVTVSVTTPAGNSNFLPGGFTYLDPVVATAILPSAGPIQGTSVNLTGANFVAGDTAVVVDGTTLPAARVIVSSSSLLRVNMPAASVAGVAAVQVINTAGAVDDVPGGFTYYPSPTATSLSVTSGPTGGGTTITITGTNFVNGQTTVTMGDALVAANDVTLNPNGTITFNAPANPPGLVDVTVTTPGGTTLAIAGGFRYEAAPAGLTLSVPGGPITAGSVITITGTGFVAGDTKVYVDNVLLAADKVVVNSATSISVTMPNHAAGAVDIKVETAGGSATIPGAYTYYDAPVATSVSTAFGSTTGGTSVTVTGLNFVVGSTAVTIGGTPVPAASITVNNANSLTFITPAHNPGLVDITMTTLGGSVSLAQSFRFSGQPTTASINPVMGAADGSTVATITGTGFVGSNTTVYVDSNPVPAADVTVNSSTSLTVKMPSHSAGVVDVTVQTAGGTSIPITGGFTYKDAPTVGGLSASFGSTAGGATLTINGSNFVAGQTAVYLGTVEIPAASVTVTGDNSLSFLIPAQAAGTVAVAIKTPGGTSAPVSVNFTYVAAPTAGAISVTAGPATGGTTIALTGTNFVAGNTTVTVGNTPAINVTVISDDSLTFETPAHTAGTFDVQVQTAGGNNTLVNSYTYVDAPIASSLSVPYGKTAGGETITITGSNFIGSGGTTVSVGGIAATVVFNSTTSISFTTPAHAAGIVDVTVGTIGGPSNPVPGGFRYEDAPTIGNITPTSGKAGTIITLSGTNFVAGNTNVYVDGALVAADKMQVASSTTLLVTMPSHAGGVVPIKVETAGGDMTSSFTYVDQPTLSSVDVTVGSTAGGTDIILTGTNFASVAAGGTAVTIGGTPVPSGSITYISDTSLKFTTPTHVAGLVDITVTTAGGTSNSLQNAFRYVDMPTAGSVSPSYGALNTSGTTLTLTGTGFVAGSTTVLVDGSPLAQSAVSVNSSTTLSVVIPGSTTAGSVALTVQTPGGSSPTPVNFTYLNGPTATALSVGYGSSGGGTSVTITGSNFLSNYTSVQVNTMTVPANQVQVTSDTSLTFVTPMHAAGQVAIAVVTPGGTTQPIQNGFVFEDIPTIGALSVNSGPADGGTVVTITGTNFVVGDTRVFIDGVAVSTNVTVNTEQSLTVTMPTHAAGTVNLTVGNTAGTSPTALPFTYVGGPVATSLSTNYGSSAGGAVLTLTGSNFVVGNTAVYIGGVPATNVTVIDANSLSFTLPAVVAGTYGVVVQTPGGNGTLPTSFTYEDQPAASSLSTAFGPSSGGTFVTITGSNFVAGDTRVLINGVAVAANLVSVTSPTSILLTTPPHAAGAVAIAVQTTAGNSTPALNFTFEDMSTATSLSQAYGSTAGGLSVTITGTNFVAGDTSVSVGGNVVPAVVGAGGTSLTFTTPAASTAGTVPVRVITSAGPSEPVPGGFTYEDQPTVTAINPTSGLPSGGTVVTITGTNFVAGDTKVIFDSTELAATVNSATSLTFTTPAHAVGTINDVAVKTSGGTSAPPVSYSYTAVAPSATSISPAFGAIGGGMDATITGTNFSAGNTTVTIGGNIVTATVTSDTSLFFRVPAGSAHGSVPVYVTVSGINSGYIPGGFYYEDTPTALSLHPNSGFVTGQTPVTVEGTNFVPGDTSIILGGPPLTSHHQGHTRSSFNLIIIPPSDVTVNSTTSLTFNTPDSVAGPTSVQVSTSGGGTTPYIPGGFTYTDRSATATSLTPAQGPAAGNTSVTITGTNFENGTTSVTIDNTTIPAGSVQFNSDTSITFVTPTHAAGTVNVSVTTSEGTTGFVPGGFTYIAQPTATSLDVQSGSVRGGTLVTVTGTDFISGATTVTIGGNTVAARAVTVNSSNSLSFRTPAHSAGPVNVSVTTLGGTSQGTNTFTYLDGPVVTSLVNAFGSTSGGTSVTLNGSNFVPGATTVAIDGITVVPTSVTTTSLTFLTPAHAAGNVPVTVTTAGGTSTAVTGGFTYEAKPSVTAVNPASGKISGNYTLTITGTNFVAGDTQVIIGGNTLQTSAVTVNSSTSLSILAPSHSAGAVDVIVSTTGGGNSDTLTNGFNYVDVPTITSMTNVYGPVGGSTTVTVNGTNFIPGATSVTIGGATVDASLVSATSTQLTFDTPAHDPGNVAVTVTTVGGTSLAGAGGFTYASLPTVTSVSPPSGRLSGGAYLTITGSNFIPGHTQVIIGTHLIAAADVLVNASTSLNVTSPANAAGAVDVQVVTDGGPSVILTNGFTYLNSPTVTSLTNAYGSTAGGTTVQLQGANFVVGSTTVTIGDVTVTANVTDDTHLSFVTPGHAAGVVGVTVTTPGGTSPSLPSSFTYENDPTVTSVSPSSGPLTGGTLLTINGTNFIAGDTSVQIGSNAVPSNDIMVNSATSITVHSPSTPTAGAVNVIVTTSANSNTLTNGFTYVAAPTVATVSPGFGPVTGNTTVTVTGTNFIAGATSVTFGNVEIPASLVTVNPPSSLTFSTPAQSAGSVGIVVTTAGGPSATLAGVFRYEALPTITAITPTSGPTAGNTDVTITGTNFVAGNTSVSFGGTVVGAADVTVNSATSLSCKTPAKAAGVVDVQVITGGGTSLALTGGYNYLNAPTTASVSPTVGLSTSSTTTLTVKGTNFIQGATSVAIDGTTIPAGSVTVTGTDTLTFTAPAHAAGIVGITVTTAGGISPAVPGGYTYADPPTLTSISPPGGPLTGGTTLTLTGTNFITGNTSVYIDGVLITSDKVVINSPTSISVQTSAHSVGSVPVRVQTNAGSDTLANSFTYYDLPTVTNVSPQFGSITGGRTVALQGTNFVTGATTVTIGGNTVSATVTGATALTFVTPAHAAGLVGLTVTTAGGTSATYDNAFRYENQPTLTTVSPTSGPLGGTTTVTLTGTGFVSGDTHVVIGGTDLDPTQVTVNSSTTLTFATPAHSAGAVPVKVYTSGGNSNELAGAFNYLAAPTVSAISPAFGIVTGGTSVVITGTNFVTGTTSVNIGGVAATNVIVDSATSIRCQTAAHAAGLVGVSVATTGGVSNSLENAFRYEDVPSITAISPSSGPLTGSTSVTLTGTNFVSGDTFVTIGGTTIPPSSVTVYSATSLSFTAPSKAAGNVAVTVATTGGGSSQPVAGGFTYLPVPTTTGVSPTSGTTAGGTTLTVTGTNFVVGATTVSIGGTLIPANAVSVAAGGTSLTFTSPARSAGSVGITVTTGGGTSNSSGYSYLAPRMSSCTAPLPSLLGIQLLTCVGANLTLFNTTFLKASGSAACSTFPTQAVLPSINILGQVLVTATSVPSILGFGLIGCSVQLCSDSSCSILGGTVPPVLVRLGL
ncbi:MAG: IPT/TIG domain-containing protein [Legionella sp.]|nr:IPT/TIG domain-containing protein [Legionella sp.]